MIDLKLFVTVFSTVFVAEIGDKTQLSTILFSSEAAGGRWTVFFAAALALTLAAGLGVLAGGIITKVISPKSLNWVAGGAFIAIGVWTIVKG